MFKITKGDLAKKSDAQLTALFQEVSNHIQPDQAHLPSARSLLAMICAEITDRLRKAHGPTL